MREYVGRSAGYELDPGLAFVRALLVPLFREESRLRDKLMSALARGSGKLEPKPTAVALFGSVARGMRDFREVDLLCIVAKQRDKSLLHDSIGDAYNQIQREFKVPVSAVVATNVELSSPKPESVVGETKRDGLLLFGTAPRQLRGIRILETEARRARSAALAV